MSSFVLLLSPLYISICFFLSYIYSIISLSLLTFYRFQLLIDWERKIAIVIIIHYQLTFFDVEHHASREDQDHLMDYYKINPNPRANAATSPP